jgi:hypothetical protein
MGDWNLEGRFELCLVFTKANLIAGSSSTDKKRHRIDEQRLTGSGLSGQHSKP